MKILITGTAGFIGFHFVNRLLNERDEIVGLDSINDYYDVNIKYDRLLIHGIAQEKIAYNTIIQSDIHLNYKFVQLKLEDRKNIADLFATEKFDVVVNLAAQAGVRYSISNPNAYIDSNIVGFANLLESCRHHQIKHFVYASSSSIYGLNEAIPFATSQNTDHPISLYAASKKSNELMAHVYSQLFSIPTTGLRFFTVYGPWSRPDMALFLFTKAIIEGKPIQVFNNGEMERDFTYVDDIVEGVYRVMLTIPKANPDWDAKHPDPAGSKAPYKIFNIGNNNPVKLMTFIEAIEKEVGTKAIKEMMPLQKGDLLITSADISDLTAAIGYKPSTGIEAGVKNFVSWYRNYYKV